MKQLTKLTSLVIVFCLLALTQATAQKLNHVLGDIMIKPASDKAMEDLVNDLQYFQQTPTQVRLIRQVSEPLNVWLLHFDYRTIHERNFLLHLQNHPDIEVAQVNHIISLRETTPDDPLFVDQWQYINTGANGGTVDGDIDADQAWDITTGGVTTDGDTIVAAVLDDGIDIDHEDFGNNRWINYAEIPNNGIDDDNNGYVDDYDGWNIASDNDNINGGGHGTPVAGIVGAKGNNGIGVAGVNWNVKVMVIKNDFSTDEAEVLEAYSYPLQMRRMYNDSEGAEGAFVVSTNASWGVNFGDPANAPLWCAFYDTLGVAGIISCGATINGNQDVDVVGDLPTACPSDYMIAVTNMNRMDVKVTGAGYGATTIDLGAHGADAYTTANNNSYGGFGGTSGATPHVTGAIALMYSAPCPNLIALAKADPATAALQVKQYIFDGVDPNASLEGITTTGGRLNIFNSLQLIMSNCGPCPPSSALSASSITDVAATLNWTPGVNAISSTLRYRAVGAMNWTEITNATSPYPIINLTACTDYEFQVNAICDTENSEFTDSFTFTTDGCCTAPDGITLSDIQNNSATLNWNEVLAANSYEITISEGANVVLNTNVTAPPFTITGLEPCSEYQVTIASVCTGGTTDPSNAVSFSTFGCGSCTDLEYCEMAGEETTFEWIEMVELNTISNTSGSDDGYGDYTGGPSTDLLTFNSYDITLTPGFDGTAYNEYFKVWIDFNQDGEFDSNTELAFDSQGGVQEAITGNIMVPGNAVLGTTRMRVAMRWAGNNNNEPLNCTSFDPGEVEDYCVNIMEGEPPMGCDVPLNLDTMEVLETTAVITWEDPSDDHVDHNLEYKKTADATWTVLENLDSPYTLNSLDDCTSYDVRVQANCVDGNVSEYTEVKTFLTDCMINTNQPRNDFEWSVFPNPFNHKVFFAFDQSRAGSVTVELLNTLGQRVYFEQLTTVAGNQQLSTTSLNELAGGIYFLKVTTPDGKAVQRLMKY